jgi:Flp pilus assembly pilin Flp
MDVRHVTLRQLWRSDTVCRRTSLRRAIVDDCGQDLIEYALLGALVGVVAILIWQLLVETIYDVYSGADADVQTLSGCTPDPGGGGCP